MPEVILPCTDCGGECIAVREPTIDLNEWRMHCFCGYAGRYCASEEDAIKAHNTLPRMSALIAWQLQAAGIALALQRLIDAAKNMREAQQALENLIGVDDGTRMQAACKLCDAEDAFDDILAKHRKTLNFVK